MHTVKVKFKILKNGKREKQIGLIYSMLGTWRMNGQILGKHFPVVSKREYFVSYLNTPEKQSLSKKYNNKYGAKQYSNLLGAGLAKPQIKVLGKEPESLSLCKCNEVKKYILFTTYLCLESPLRCYECFGAIPLYKIPKTYHDEYYNILCWQSDYQSCDSLQMNCKVGERFAMNQLLKVDSPLSKQGLEVCKTIESATKKKTYYYLYKGTGKTFGLEVLRKCPNCNGEWYRKKALHNLFNFVCKKCTLLSNVAWDLE